MESSYEDVRTRVEDAALSLFVERGYAETTVSEIADRAGLARRTCFRYFANKREILFWGQQIVADAQAKAVAGARLGVSPLALASLALFAAADIMEPRRELIRKRQAVISASVELQERELLKRSQLADSLAAAMTARGVQPLAAAVNAHAALGAYSIAFTRWADGQVDSLHDSVSEAIYCLTS